VGADDATIVRAFIQEVDRDKIVLSGDRESCTRRALL
jgi:hypothetical protein